MRLTGLSKQEIYDLIHNGKLKVRKASKSVCSRWCQRWLCKEFEKYSTIIIEKFTFEILSGILLHYHLHGKTNLCS